MSPEATPPLPDPPAPRDDPPSRLIDVLRACVSFAVLLVVLAAVIVLVISGHQAPAVAIGTVTTAGYISIEIGRRVLGLPPTRFGAAIEAGVKTFVGTLSSSPGQPTPNLTQEPPTERGQTEARDDATP
jgi:hypothetical protein